MARRKKVVVPKQFDVRVVEGCRWHTVTVNGRHFFKHDGVVISEDDLSDEIRRSKMLVVSEVKEGGDDG